MNYLETQIKEIDSKIESLSLNKEQLIKIKEISPNANYRNIDGKKILFGNFDYVDEVICHYINGRTYVDFINKIDDICFYS